MLAGEIRPRPGEHILDDGEGRAAVRAYVPVLGFGKPGIERDRDRAGMHGAQPRGGEFRRVAHHQQHALAGCHAQQAQRAGRARDFGRERLVAEGLFAADERDPLAVAGQGGAAQKMLDGIHGGGKIVWDPNRLCPIP